MKTAGPGCSIAAICGAKEVRLFVIICTIPNAVDWKSVGNMPIGATHEVYCTACRPNLRTNRKYGSK